MFFPFTNYKVIDCPTTNGNGFLYYTATAKCVVFFMPIGSRMEDDSPVGLQVPNYFLDTDSQWSSLMLFFSWANGQLNQVDGIDPGRSNVLVPGFLEPGHEVRAIVANNTDRIGGTLYVFELP